MADSSSQPASQPASQRASQTTTGTTINGMVNLWLLVVATTLATTLGGQTHQRRSLQPSALSLLASAVAPPTTTDGTRPRSKKSDDEENDEEDDDDINRSPGSGAATPPPTRSNAAHNQATKIKVAAPRNKKERTPAAVASPDDADDDDADGDCADGDGADGVESPPSPSPFALLGNPLVKQVGGPHEPDTPPTNLLTLLFPLCLFIPSRVPVDSSPRPLCTCSRRGSS